MINCKFKCSKFWMRYGRRSFKNFNQKTFKHFELLQKKKYDFKIDFNLKWSSHFFQHASSKRYRESFSLFSFESIWSKGWIRSIFISQRVIIEQLFGTDHRMLNYKDEDKKVFKPTCNSRLKFESELLYSKISFQTSILFIITNRKS